MNKTKINGNKMKRAPRERQKKSEQTAETCQEMNSWNGEKCKTRLPHHPFTQNTHTQHTSFTKFSLEIFHFFPLRPDIFGHSFFRFVYYRSLYTYWALVFSVFVCVFVCSKCIEHIFIFVCWFISFSVAIWTFALFGVWLLVECMYGLFYDQPLS